MEKGPRGCGEGAGSCGNVPGAGEQVQGAVGEAERRRMGGAERAEGELELQQFVKCILERDEVLREGGTAGGGHPVPLL